MMPNERKNHGSCFVSTQTTVDLPPAIVHDPNLQADSRVSDLPEKCFDLGGSNVMVRG